MLSKLSTLVRFQSYTTDRQSSFIPVHGQSSFIPVHGIIVALNSSFIHNWEFEFCVLIKTFTKCANLSKHFGHLPGQMVFFYKFSGGLNLNFLQEFISVDQCRHKNNLKQSFLFYTIFNLFARWSTRIELQDQNAKQKLSTGIEEDKTLIKTNSNKTKLLC